MNREIAQITRTLCLAIAIAIALPRVASAQDNLADKANARTLATEGIDLYNEGRYAEALDRLQRAQALFDAPIHLLYIARAQTQLGQLVEATETYRRLIRVELTADTPQAVREAVEAGDTELDGVDARVAMLRIDVVPTGESGLVLVIDGETVSSAVVGVDRPLNPGHHRIRASVPDGRSAETSIELGEGSRASVRLELGPAPAVSRMKPIASEELPSPALAWFVGAGLGLALPAGNVARSPEVPLSDYVKAGATLELHGGIWFARYFGAKLFVEASGFAASVPPNDFGQLGAGASASDRAKIEPSASGQAFGLSVLVGSPPLRFGGYGELGLVLRERLVHSQEFAFPSDQCAGKAKQTLTLTGGALRLGGGAFIPISRVFQLTPFVRGSFGRFTQASLDSDCNDLGQTDGLEGSIPDGRKATHGMIHVGVGGELLFGVK